MHRRLELSKCEIIGLLLAIGAVAFYFQRGLYQRWAALVIVTHFVLFDLFCLWYDASLLKGLFLALITGTMFLMLVAVAFSMHHPPCMVPPGWHWPAFQSIGERLVHALMLSLWQVILAPVGIAIAFVFALLTRHPLSIKSHEYGDIEYLD